MSEHISKVSYVDARHLRSVDLGTTAIITAYPTIDMIDVVSPDGDQISSPQAISWRERTQERLTELAEFSELARNDEYTKSELKEALGINAQETTRFLKMASSVLPEEALSCIETPEAGKMYTVGRFVVANSIASATEAERQRAKLHRNMPVKERRMKEAAETADLNKLHLRSYNHAVVTVDGVDLQLELDTPMGILSARLIERLNASVAEQKPVRRGELAKDLWSKMSLDERLLFTDTMAHGKKYRPYNEAIAGAVLGTRLESLFTYIFTKANVNSNEPLMNRVPFTADTYRPASFITIKLNKEPTTKEYRQFRTDRDITDVSPQHVSAAKSVMELLPGLTTKKDMADANFVLTAIADPETRFALLCMSGQNSGESDEFIESIHREVRGAMGDDIYEAIQESRENDQRRGLRSKKG